MAVLFFSGYETGDFLEWTSTSGAPTIDTTTVTLGKNSEKAVSATNLTGGQFAQINLSAAQSTIFIRFNLFISVVPNSLTANQTGLVFVGNTGVITETMELDLKSDASGNPSLSVWNKITSTEIGSVRVDKGRYYTVELRVVINASTGVLELKVNNTIVVPGTGLNTGSTNTQGVQIGCFNNSAVGASTVFIDDVLIASTGPIGPGYCIARQPTGNGNYTGWTLSTGTLASCWNTTPFNTTTFISGTTASIATTGPADFTLTGGTGSTGFGTGIVQVADSINAMKICGVGKTASVSGDGFDSWRFRTPAGGGGVDSNTGMSPWAVADAYREAIFTTPTTAQVRSCEYGIVKTATGALLHTVEDAWIMVDFTQFGNLPMAVLGRGKRRFFKKPVVTTIKKPKRSVHIFSLHSPTNPAFDPHLPILTRGKRRPFKRPPPRKMRRSVHVFNLQNPQSASAPMPILGRGKRKPFRKVSGVKRHRPFKVPTFQNPQSVSVPMPVLARGKRQKFRKPQGVKRHRPFKTPSLQSPQSPSLPQPIMTVRRRPPAKVRKRRKSVPSSGFLFNLVKGIVTVVVDAIVNWRERGGY